MLFAQCFVSLEVIIGLGLFVSCEEAGEEIARRKERQKEIKIQGRFLDYSTMIPLAQ